MIKQIFGTSRARAGLMLVSGVVLLALALALLAINERQVLAWQQAMARHGGTLLDAGADAQPAAGQYGHMLRVTGTPRMVTPTRDSQFNVQVETSQLLRKVEMFQWHEIRVGGQVHYDQDWVDHTVDSSKFALPRGHANPGVMPFPGARFVASDVRLGGYRLAAPIVRALPPVMHAVPVKLTQLPPNLAASFHDKDGVLTTAAAGETPHLGDLRVSWQAVAIKPVTVIARVEGDRLVPASSASSGQGFQVQLGNRSLGDVLPDLPPQPTSTWTWRLLTLLVAWAGAVLLWRAWQRRRVDVVAPLAVAVALYALVIGLVWIGFSLLTGVLAWVVAVVAAGAALYRWRQTRSRIA